MNKPVDASLETATVRRLRRVMAVFTGLLVASTWPLWMPVTAFPDIPWLGVMCRAVPDSGEMAPVGNLAVFLLLQFLEIKRVWLRRSLCGYFFLASVPWLLLLDQHRLQPWAWQMLLGAVLIGLSATSSSVLRRLRWLTISIYVWSAVSKIDWAFIEGHGQVLLQGLTESVGLSTSLWSQNLCRSLAVLFPLGELAVSCSLMLPRLRRVGLWGATLMHVGLLLALGPAGLGHHWGVLIWNVFFIVNVWLLFGRGAAQDAGAGGNPQPRDPDDAPLIAPMTVMTWLMCLLPALSLIGLWDWWPSWAVYSSRPAIVEMRVRRADVERLPASLRRHVGAPQPLSEWYTVHLDAWSYETCWCPLYPQERYRLAVIAAIANRVDVDPQVVVRSSPNRWTGERLQRTLNRASLDEQLTTYWINTADRHQR